ncbi:hypothetical protein [Rhodovulum euryhalinum]|uniref:Uncharacterized protein n=1 Tax=Rhodovulum euryhalinum TaxID=35805 RepID=A0A4V2S9U4_9RHOB|nr:hypothetical protein [Rhodovulum euryhalinum]TCO69210.1 hypothetical protein EV655_11743 [Rhodovulum euryhalinum]
MEYKIVDEEFVREVRPEPKRPHRDRKAFWASPRLHAVTPDVSLKQWDGVPPFGIVAFIGYLIALTVVFSDQVVPYCIENFAQPQNCAPIFDRVLPIALAAIVVVPAVSGAVRRMGGNRAASQALAVTAVLMPPLILGWQLLV